MITLKNTLTSLYYFSESIKLFQNKIVLIKLKKNTVTRYRILG